MHVVRKSVPMKDARGGRAATFRLTVSGRYRGTPPRTSFDGGNARGRSGAAAPMQRTLECPL